MHNECIEYQLDGFEFFKWYHYCLIYEDRPIDSEVGGHETIMNLYINGEKVNEREFRLIFQSTNLSFRVSIHTPHFSISSC